MSEVTAHPVGKLVQISGTFRDSNNNLVDPTTVELVVEAPDGTKRTYSQGVSPSEVETTGTGVYFAWVETTLIGLYRWRWVSTGTGQAAEPGEFRTHGGTPTP